MARNVYFSVCVVLLCSQLIHVIGHGWLMTPTPRSGGGAGSGNASTSNPCGKAGPSTVVGSFAVGTTIQTQFKAVNGHGGPCTGCVTFTLSYQAASAANPAASDFPGTSGIVFTNKGDMNPNTGATETLALSIPANAKTGAAVLQFAWQAVDGSKWFDCAYVQITAPAQPSPCLTGNGGCSPSATCSTDANNKAVCTCQAGFIGDGITCNALPSDVQVILQVNATTLVQNTFTDNIAAVLGISSSRILYDHTGNDTRPDGRGYAALAYFAITADPTTGESGMVQALQLRTYVSTESPMLNSLGYGVLTVRVPSIDANPIAYGGPIPSSSNSLSSNASGLIAGAVISTVALVGFLVYLRARRQGSSSKTSSNFSHMQAKSTPAAVVVTTTTVSSAAPVAAHAVNAPHPPHDTASVPTGWTLYHTDDGVPYYHNDVTGESQWEIPRA